MKTTLFIFIGVLFFSCTMYNPFKNELASKITFTAQLGGWVHPDTAGIIFIKTSLYNKSADTLTYLRMSCSWADAYTTDNDSLRIEFTPCFQNGPLVMTLLPHQTTDEYIRVIAKGTTREWQGWKFRVGYNFNLYDSTKDIHYNVSKLTDRRNIFWSDTLRLSDFWKH